MSHLKNLREKMKAWSERARVGMKDRSDQEVSFLRLYAFFRLLCFHYRATFLLSTTSPRPAPILRDPHDQSFDAKQTSFRGMAGVDCLPM